MIIYTLEQRTKEMGIRKVVGASVLNIWTLILKEYIYLIAVAIVVSTPCCILFLNNWLQDFNYHITISPWLFVAAGACLVTIAIVISGYFVIKAALSNPVEVLKDE
jgi:putative ABC transport system permease protein